MHVLFSLSRIIMSGLLLGMVLSVCTCLFHGTVTLPPWLVSTDFGICSYQCFCPILLLFPCICWSVDVHSLYHVFLCTVFCQCWACRYFMAYFLIALKDTLLLPIFILRKNSKVLSMVDPIQISRCFVKTLSYLFLNIWMGETQIIIFWVNCLIS
jgi:hypothetical protein